MFKFTAKCRAAPRQIASRARAGHKHPFALEGRAARRARPEFPSVARAQQEKTPSPARELAGAAFGVEANPRS
jgi:hypothetical protein